MNDLLTNLLQALDSPAARHHRLNRYYAGESPLAFLSPEAKKALGNRLHTLPVNIPRLVVDSLAERLRVTGFEGVDVWPDWLANDLDQTSALCHRETLILGTGYVIVWAGPDGRPTVTVESAEQVTTVHDPATRRVTAALKRWETDKTTEVVLYEPEVITRYRANSKGAAAGFVIVEQIDNPLGVVPVVRFRNSTRVLGQGESEMSDVLGLTDAVQKLTTDMLVGSEFAARPRRWATGLEIDEDDDGNPVNPIGESDRLMVNESADGKFGQLPGSDLAGYTEALGTLFRQISAVTGLPEHMLGIGGDNPTSADSIRASEAALTAKAEARQAVFGRQWEQVARLVVAVRDGADVAEVQPRILWADPATRSVAQEADAIVKLFGAGLLPASTALRRLGYSEDEIRTIGLERSRDATTAVDLSQVL